MIDRDFTLSLCALQEAVQKATIEAKRVGDERTYSELRRLAWTTARLVTECGRDQADEQVAS